MTAVCMIYGANGYMGREILDAALAQGLRPVIAGRNEAAVRGLAAQYGLSYRDFTLDDPAAMVAALRDVDVVLNAAGPFPVTARHLAQVCIEEGVHYLDIGSDLAAQERLAELDAPARDAGVTVLAGAGFSPAVGEALAIHLKRRLPRTVKLEIAVSHLLPPTAGQIRACLDIAPGPSRALRRGRIKTMRRRRMRRFDFGRGPVRCYGLGWGELAAIYRSTGVRNVDFFIQRRRDLSPLVRMSGLRAAFYRLPPARRRLDAWAAVRGAGASPELRKRARTRVVGHAYDPDGQRAVTRLHLPDLYTVTAEIAVFALVRILTSDVKPGVLSPAQHLGADFLSEIPDLHLDWEELEISAPGELPLRIRRHVPWWWRLMPPSLVRRRTEGRTGPSHPSGSGERPSGTGSRPARHCASPRRAEDVRQAEAEGTADLASPPRSGSGSGGGAASDDSMPETTDRAHRTATG